MSSVKSLGSSSNTSHRPVKRTIEPEQECEEGIRENVEKNEFSRYESSLQREKRRHYNLQNMP